jgi:hypothetical protein
VILLYEFMGLDDKGSDENRKNVPDGWLVE